ncbi:MAG: ArsR family transcriptional regulator, arsenate/arsenite/antimonite-responsive transcriptional [Clostridia bacterium]|nr:regulatory protein ArsR [Clostridiales bacterium]MDK2985282.1 ArsR family transcriptional regulator, arsenate/arsenite/antimonite-responsive transcriptional [Clostridia bacterium]
MEKLNKYLKAMGDETRFKIINLLLTHNLCVGALAHRLGISEAAVSQHLQVLRKAGLVKGEKRGYWTHYSVQRELIVEIANELKKLVDQPVINGSFCKKKSSNEGNCCKEKENENSR